MLTFPARTFSIVLAAILALAFQAFGVSPARALPVKTQPSCVAFEADFCTQFDPGGASIPVIRTIAFHAPRKGVAKVMFHGTLLCRRIVATGAQLSLASQIVSGAETASEDGPGGLLHRTSFEAGLTSRTFNLDSTRIFHFAAAGDNTYSFKIVRHAATTPDTNTNCVVYDATFTVQFVAASEPEVVKAQHPCVTSGSGDRCRRLLPNSIPVIRAFTFDAPSAGRAEVNFHGSLTCSNTYTQRAFAEFDTRIVVNNSEPIANDTAGGLSQALTMEPGNVIKRFDSTNLSATRVVALPKGKTTFQFKMSHATGLDFTPNTSCVVHNAVFTVQFLPNSAQAIARIVTQRACPSDPSHWCKQIPSGSSMPWSRDMVFNAPSRGIAVISVHGSLRCGSFDATTNRVVDFASQIVTDQNANPDVAGPGGLRHVDVLLPAGNGGDGGQFSLASTRTLDIPAAGNQFYYFVLARTRQDDNTICFVSNVTFTVNFMAKPN
jgi:hypothetical protein